MYLEKINSLNIYQAASNGIGFERISFDILKSLLKKREIIL